MAQETYPSPPAEKYDPPQYHEEHNAVQSHFNEKESSILTSHPCAKHSPSPTTFLDEHLTTPSAKAAAHTLTTAIGDATDGQHCTRCTANDAAKTLTRYIFELRQSKKTGGMSKEVKRAAKTELKGLMREVKGVVREEKARFKREGMKA